MLHSPSAWKNSSLVGDVSITSDSDDDFPDELILDVALLHRQSQQHQERANARFLEDEERAEQEAAKELTAFTATVHALRATRDDVPVASTSVEFEETPVGRRAFKDVSNNLTQPGVKKDLQASLKTPTSTMPAQTGMVKHRFSPESLSLTASKAELFDGRESGKTLSEYVDMVIADNPFLDQAMKGAIRQDDEALFSAAQRDALAADTNCGVRQLQARLKEMGENQHQCNQLHAARYDTIAQALQLKDDEPQTRKHIIPKMSVPKFGQRNVAAKPASRSAKPASRSAKPASRSAQSASRSASAAKRAPDDKKKTNRWVPPKKGWR
eukprot:CAMPEP_0178667466 /NCGR_PEP_ID=MMETSP0698-20121128/31057_1 /TAXON_ID=265572 /ORGANISM="Extubocellulus spinifer, Strain CCMP396" /LENGTH=325 /DNA_ID=CAMNT_0020310959 /DNA_START=556 /DNA_END=1533 /DNA_ORIENTATION=-